MKSFICFIILFSCMYLTTIFAQTDTSSFFRVTLKDGSELIGNIIDESDSTLQFSTNSGLEVVIKKANIIQTKKIKGGWKDGKYFRLDPNNSRLFIAPTARTHKSGEGFFSVYEVFFPAFSYGVTDFITLGGGFSLIPGAEQQMVYFAPKIRLVNFDGFKLSSGLFYLNAFGYTGGFTYGVISTGTDFSGASFGICFPFSSNSSSKNALVIIGGEAQVSNYVKLITENWISTEGGGTIISFGIRFFGEKLAGDFGLITSLSSGSSGFPFFPWLGITYNF